MLSILLLAAGIGTTYPAALRVEASPQARSALYVHDGPGIGAPPGEASFSFVGKDALAEYGQVAARLFQPAAATALELRIVSVTPSVEFREGVWHAVVRHELRLSDPRGSALASWTVEGRGRIEGLGEGALPNAFQDATEVAVRDFEARFEEPAAVVSLLATLGVPAGSVQRRRAIAEKPAPPPPLPPEMRMAPAGPALYLDAGGHLADLGYHTTQNTLVSTHDALATGFDVRLGIATWWLFAEALLSQGSHRAVDVGHAMTSVGADFGVQARVHRALEVAVGVGLLSSHVAVSSYGFGPQPVTMATWQGEQDLVAAVRMLPSLGQRLRLRFTFEGRYRLGSFQTAMVNGRFHDDIDSGFTVSLLIGMDLRMRRAEAR